MEIMQLFKTIIIISLFYSFAITMVTHATPSDALGHVTAFSDVGEEIDLNSVSSDIEESMQRQTNIPVVEMGALVYYSGNILLDLIINFVTAIPQMIGMLVHGLTMLFGLDSYLFAVVQIFATVIITVMYLIGVIQLIVGIRAGRSIV